MNRRFTVEEVDNGWLVKMTDARSDQLLRRTVYTDIQKLFEFLRDEFLNKPKETK